MSSVPGVSVGDTLADGLGELDHVTRCPASATSGKAANLSPLVPRPYNEPLFYLDFLGEKAFNRPNPRGSWPRIGLSKKKNTYASIF